MITETWLTPDIDDSCLSFCPDYQIFRQDRANRIHGGCLVLIHNSISANLYCSHCFEGYIEVIVLKVRFLKQSFFLITVYRSPSSPKSADESLISLLNNLPANRDYLVTGDFNLPDLFPNGPIQTVSANFNEVFKFRGFIQKVSAPTRGDNILDLVLTNDPQLVSNLSVNTPFSSSDHNSVSFDLNINLDTDKTNSIKYYDYHAADYIGMSAWLETIDWSQLFTPDSSVDVLWNTFSNILEYAIELFVPKRNKKRKCSKWSLKTKKAYSNKLRAWKRLKRVSSDVNQNLYRKASLEAKSNCRADVEAVEQKILSSKSLKTFYSFVNSKLTSKNQIPPLKLNDYVADDPADKANLLQDQFSSVFTVDDYNLPNFVSRTQKTIPDINITESLVLKALKRLPNKISSGPDSVPPLILKKVSSSIASPLCQIFAKSLETGIVPAIWLVGEIAAVYKKKGDSSLPSNYRPISLTVAASKAMELIVKDHVMAFLKDNNLISTKQHGFLSRRSTLTNVLSTLNNWFKARLEKLSVHSIYIDFAKAFDTVSHPKLLYKLSKYGISGPILAWIKAFLSNRTQYVKVSGAKSRICPVTSGVPQGTILGPVLFLLFVNDSADVILHSHISLYADDAKIFHFASSDTSCVDALQEDLGRVHEWSKSWQLSVAFHKCSVFVFGSSAVAPEYSLGGSPLGVVNEINDLGFTLTANQKSSLHCEKISKKALRISANIFRVFKTRNTNFLLQMCNTYVRPLVECGVQIWSPHLLKDIDAIEKVQRSFTKRIPSVRHLPYDQRLTVLCIDSLEKRRISADLHLCYKIIKNMIDLNFDDFFGYSNETVTRSHHLRLKAPFALPETVNNSFTYRVPKIWNVLPSEIVSAPNLKVFKVMLHDFDFSSFLRGRGVR
jgi:hypothetical protein